MSSNTLIESLNKAFVDTYALYLKTQNYHWNVEGPNFKSLHALFEEQYTDLANAVDSLAEQLRMLGVRTKATFSHFNTLKTIDDANENADAQTMLKTLAADQDKMLATLNNVLSAAQKAGDEATADMIINRLEKHKKNAWMLKSSL